MNAVWYASNNNNYNREWNFKTSKNIHPIQIHRDENEIAYVFAENKEDVILSQTFCAGERPSFSGRILSCFDKMRRSEFKGEFFVAIWHKNADH